MKKALIIAIASFVLIFGGLAVANAINASAMNDYIDSFAKVEIEDQLKPSLDEDGVPYFVTDRDFKIMSKLCY